MERTIILQGFDLLKKEKLYHQACVVEKLNFLGIQISKAAFNKIVNGKTVRKSTLLGVCNGIQQLVGSELGHFWRKKGFLKTTDKSWEPTVVGRLVPESPSLMYKPGFAYHPNGRLEIAEKVAFISTAKVEVIEFGVSLNTFSNYFTSRNDEEFKAPVMKLLDDGVHFKCYMLNPNCSLALAYFSDSPTRKIDERKIQSAMEQLGQTREEFRATKRKGAFEVFTYKHIPYNHFMAVDPATDNGKMMVSHYIFGEPKAKCPVVEIHKKQNAYLFNRYYNSLLRLVNGAEPLP